MIPKKLTIHGLYSYQEPTRIDFAPLIGSGIFGIFGKVGSGKSSILEAISFALYGESDRLNSRDNRSQNMVNLRSDRLSIELLCDIEGTEYRFCVHGRRGQAFERTVTKKEHGKWSAPLASTDATELMKLSYQNFRRTIIIPQGRFEEFLKITESERTKMLKELFNLDRFDLSGRVRSLELKNKEKMDNLKGQLEQIGEIDEEKISLQKKEIEEIHNQLVVNIDELGRIEKRLQELRQKKERFDELEQIRLRLNKILLEQSRIDELQKTLDSYDFCLINFKAQLTQIDYEKQAIISLDEQIKIMRKDHDDAASLLQNLTQEYLKAEAEYKDLDNLNAEIERLEKMIALQGKQKKLLEIQQMIAVKEPLTLQTQTKIDELKAKTLHAKERLVIKKKDLLPIEEMESLQKSLSDANAIHELTKSKQQQLQDKLMTKERTSKRLSEICALYEKCDDLVALLEKKKQRFQEQMQILRKQVLDSSVQERLSELASGLNADEPCPVCGSTDHPHLAKTPIDASELKDKIAALEDNISLIEQHKEKAVVLGNALDLVCKDIDTLENELRHLRNSFDRVSIDACRNRLEKHNVTSQEMAHATAEIERDQTMLEKHAKDAELLAKEMQELKIEQAELRAELSSIELIPQEIDNTLRQNKERKSAIIQRYEKLKQEHSALQRRVGELEGKLQMQLQAYSQRENHLLRLEQQLQRTLSESPMETLGEVRDILATQINVNETKKVISEFQTDRKAVQNRYKELSKDIKGDQFDATLYDHTALRLIELQKSVEDLRTRHAVHNERIKELEKRLSEYMTKSKAYETSRKEDENIQILKNMFKANGFVNFVSAMYLEELCARANDRFRRLTNQTLQLELGENNAFMVRDFLNDGKLRSIKTLSGGQTFQAALSLAIALSDSVRKGEDHFFFLDEGFGSLDMETLHTAFMTLKSLHKENRIIGVISHVEYLQEEIDTYITVTNDSNMGSSIKGSWE